MIVGDAKPPIDELAHIGVKGMKWGVRRGKSVTGVGRVRAAAAQSLMDESRRRNTVGKAGKAGQLGYNLVRGRLGTKNTAKRQQEAAKRILKGKTRALDLLRVMGNATPIDIFVATSLKPGARGYDGNKPARK